VAGQTKTYVRLRALGAATLVASLIVVAGPAALARAATATQPVTVSPAPGSHFANPRTAISFLGVAPADIGAISVSGARSGSHDGTWTAYSNGDGSTFEPAQPFAPGETVSVHTDLDVQGASGGSFSFTTAQPSAVTATPDIDHEFDTGVHAQAVLPATPKFATRPDLQPPTLTVDTSTGTPDPGLIMLTPRGGTQFGPMIVDDTGQPVWFDPITNADFSTDAKVVHYNGQDDLTWWQGNLVGSGHGTGTYQLVDHSYRPVATIAADNGDGADLHDMLVTPAGTAIVMAYVPVAMDLTPYGGVANGSVTQLVIQEIDIATDTAMWEWDSLDHIPVTKSVVAAPADAATSWDYIHGNAIDLASDGSLLVSGRHTSQIYDVDLKNHTGAVSWTLGRGGDFTPSFADSDWFQFQHDVRERSDGSISVFDNGAGPGFPARPSSRGLVMNVDLQHHTVAIAKAVQISGTNVSASSQGSFRELPNGHNFIGWGSVGQLTEFDPTGTPILDMKFPNNVGSYRAVKQVWHGTPATAPDVVIQRNGTTVNATVSWNGATDVARWRLRAGNDPATLHSIWSSGRTGFETTVTTDTDAPVLDMQALDANGNILVTSASISATGTPDHSGYWIGEGSGAMHTFGAITASSVSPATGQHLVGIAAAPGGTWTVTGDGAITAPAGQNYGSLAGVRLHAPVVGIIATPSGRGYWMVASDGGVFTFGDAHFFGSMGGKHLAAPIVGIAPTPDGNGYWLVGSDGGVFTFGSAHFHGSAGGTRLNRPVVGIAPGADDDGYFLAGGDGGVFTYGTAHFRGSAGALKLAAPVSGIASTANAGGYWLVGRDGGVFTYGNAKFRGSLAGIGVVVTAFAHD